MLEIGGAGRNFSGACITAKGGFVNIKKKELGDSMHSNMGLYLE